MPRSRRAPRVWPLLLTVLLLSGPAQAQAPFSVENILRAPFPSEMIAAPSGDRIAWVHNKEGLRSL